MSKTEVLKTPTGDTDIGNRTSAEHSPNTATSVYIECSATIKAGTKDDTKVSYFKLDSTNADDTDIMAMAVAIDNMTIGNVSQVKKTLSINANRDIPAIVESDKSLWLVIFELEFGDGVIKRDYLRIPYARIDADIATFKTFIDGFLTDNKIYFSQGVVKATLLDVLKVKMV